jgi:hypothetical protein
MKQKLEKRTIYIPAWLQRKLLSDAKRSGQHGYVYIGNMLKAHPTHIKAFKTIKHLNGGVDPLIAEICDKMIGGE